MDRQKTLWFDTHVHLDSCEPHAEALSRAQHAGVGHLVLPGVSPSMWSILMQLATTHEGVYAAPGVHPCAADEWSSQRARELETLLARPEAVAVGEIGLDRFFTTPPMALQETVFREQLRLAINAGKPVLIHCRKAYGELLKILREEGAERVGGILHAFGGSLETAEAAIKLNFSIAFGGSLTWPGARRAPEVLRGLPQESIVIESDAPDMAPHPHRGEENRPEWLPLVAAQVARVRGWDLMQTSRITTQNALRALRLGSPASDSGKDLHG